MKKNETIEKIRKYLETDSAIFHRCCIDKVINQQYTNGRSDMLDSINKCLQNIEQEEQLEYILENELGYTVLYNNSGVVITGQTILDYINNLRDMYEKYN